MREISGGKSMQLYTYKAQHMHYDTGAFSNSVFPPFLSSSTTFPSFENILTNLYQTFARRAVILLLSHLASLKLWDHDSVYIQEKIWDGFFSLILFMSRCIDALFTKNSLLLPPTSGSELSRPPNLQSLWSNV